MKEKAVSESNVFAWRVEDFSMMQEIGKGTKWCIALNNEEFSLYHSKYDI